MTFPVTGSPDQCSIALYFTDHQSMCPERPEPGVLFRTGCLSERHMHDEHMCLLHAKAVERRESYLFCVPCQDELHEIVPIGLLQEVKVP